ASNTAEAEQMLAAATRAKRKLAVGLFRRFFPACNLIREYIAAETLGKVIDFEFSEGWMFNWPAQSASFFQKKTAQGGVFLDLGAHLLDLMLWWFGDPTSLEYFDDAMGGLEINSVARFEFANGSRGRVQLSRDWELPNKYVIRCEKGWLAHVNWLYENDRDHRCRGLHRNAIGRGLLSQRRGADSTGRSPLQESGAIVAVRTRLSDGRCPR